MIRVALIGPDGSGKSAVTKQLAERIPVPVRRIYMGVNLESSNIMLPTSRLQLAIRRWRGLPPDTDGPRSPNRRPKSTGRFGQHFFRFIKAAARTTNLIAEECFRLAVIRWWLVRGFVVIQDRDFYTDFYEYDVLDNGQPRTLFQRIHGVFLRHLYSKPDLSILLDVSARTMLARKQEGTEEELERRQQHYHELVRQMPAHAVVNAEGTLDEVTTLCRDSVLGFRQRRIAEPLNKISTLITGPPAIVIGLDCVTGLQTARILSGRGIRVIGMASRMDHFCCRTNAAEQIHEGATSGTGLVERLQSLRREFGQKPVLVPCTDLSVLTISQHRQELQSSYSFILPDHELLESLIDKAGFARFAEKHNFSVPKTRILNSQSDVHQAADDLSFPVFLKPAMKTAAWESNTKQKAVQANSPEELIAAWHKYSDFSDAMIAQEYVHGDVEDCFTVNVYFDRNSNPLCIYTSQKMRQWPPGFGTACLARYSDNTAITEQTLAFFRQVGYRGLGYIEFKRDNRSGEYLIIEPNIGRPTGRSAMADASGVPLLHSMYCDAAGIPTESAEVESSSSPPLKWVHLRRDLQAAIHAWRRGELTVGGWLTSLRGPKILAVANWKDRSPFMAEIRSYVWQLVLPERWCSICKTPAVTVRRPGLAALPKSPITNMSQPASDTIRELTLSGSR